MFENTKYTKYILPTKSEDYHVDYYFTPQEILVDAENVKRYVKEQLSRQMEEQLLAFKRYIISHSSVTCAEFREQYCFTEEKDFHLRLTGRVVLTSVNNLLINPSLDTVEIVVNKGVVVDGC